MIYPDSSEMNGADLKQWRARNSYTQEQLCVALNVRSRQTIINWEKSTGALPRMLSLALMALELWPNHAYRDGGRRATITEYKFGRDRAKALDSTYR